MFVYSLAPAANVTTNGTPDTETDHLRIVTAATRIAKICALYLTGKGAGLSAITGIITRLYRFATPSTVGTGLTARARHPASPAALTTAATGPTAGTTPTIQLAIGCGAAGPGGWVARDDGSKIQLEAGGGADGNLDLFSAAGVASMNFEYTIDFDEG